MFATRAVGCKLEGGCARTWQLLPLSSQLEGGSPLVPPEIASASSPPLLLGGGSSRRRRRSSELEGNPASPAERRNGEPEPPIRSDSNSGRSPPSEHEFWPAGIPASSGAAESRRCLAILPSEMGSTSSMLTQYDIEEVQDHCDHAFSQQEIVSLYHRFCQLDRNGGGFVSAEEFMTVPEFAVNPLSQRLLRMLDGLNFKEFVAFLSAFSPRASLQQKIEFIFRVYDTDCNGKVAFDDILSILRDLSGSFMTEQQRQKVLIHVLEEAGYTKDSHFTVPDFMKILDNSDVKMEVEVPID